MVVVYLSVNKQLHYNFYSSCLWVTAYLLVCTKKKPPYLINLMYKLIITLMQVNCFVLVLYNVCAV